MEKRYVSKFTGQLCTCPQYLAEIMCLRKAKKEGIALPPRFWSTSKWSVFYRSQMVAANAFLKTYSESILVDAVNRADCQWFFSLRSPQFAQKLAEQAETAKIAEKIRETTPRVELDLTPSGEAGISRPAFVTKSRLSDLD